MLLGFSFLNPNNSCRIVLDDRLFVSSRIFVVSDWYLLIGFASAKFQASISFAHVSFRFFFADKDRFVFLKICLHYQGLNSNKSKKPPKMAVSSSIID
jgi:hypothetical protein